jgi:hypothetical protein
MKSSSLTLADRNTFGLDAMAFIIEAGGIVGGYVLFYRDDYGQGDLKPFAWTRRLVDSKGESTAPCYLSGTFAVSMTDNKIFLSSSKGRLFADLSFKWEEV